MISNFRFDNKCIVILPSKIEFTFFAILFRYKCNSWEYMFGIVSVKAHFYDAPSIFKDVKSSQLREPDLHKVKLKYKGCLFQYDFA